MSRMLAVKWLIFLLSLFPMGLLGWKFFTHQLGANPFEVLTHDTGLWTLRLLLLTLAMRPLKNILHKAWPLQLRRLLGLLCFFYACLHLNTYLWFDHFFDWTEIWRDIVKRPFITAGMFGFVLLIPLALTSNKAMIRRLGKNWQKLHRLIYLVAVLAVLHFIWLVKADLLEPLVYTAILMLLLGYRLYVRATK